ncbi:MAG TPA: hypothetical protein VFD32_14400 [Dehalococcoidia bacterium]|nr:hypothetical protein [Dehalococcoidia bacterium]
MHDDLSDDLLHNLRRLFIGCAPIPRRPRPRPRVRCTQDEQGRPLIMIMQRDDTVLVEPGEAVKLARQLLHVARGAQATHGRAIGC